MKNRFLLACAFAMMLTGGLLQATNSTPTISRVYGDFFQQGVAPMPALGSVGALDLTFGSSTGIASLSAIGTQSTAYAVQTLSDGTYVVLLGDASNSYLAKYTETGVLDTAFGDASSGTHTLSGFKSTSSSIVVDAQGRFIICGSVNTNGSLNTPWVRRINGNGSPDSLFAWVDGAAWGTTGAINAVAQQTSGKIIAVGFNGTHSQIARYNLDGSLDTNFGTSGYIIFAGGNDINTNALPTSPTNLLSVAVDANDSIYVIYRTSSNAKVSRFLVDGAVDYTTGNFGTNGVVSATTLNCGTNLQVALDVNNNVIVAGVVSNQIKVNCYSSAGASTSFSPYATSGDSYTIYNLLTSSDDYIYLVGTDVTSKQMDVIRLCGNSQTNAGKIDNSANDTLGQAFNATGFDAFSVSSPDTSSVLLGASISPDGRLYVCGYQVNSSTTTPYIARLYNDLYAIAIPQYPAAEEQGILDYTFGASITHDLITNQTYPGVVSPYNGLYGASLQQKARTVVELEYSTLSGDLLVGMDGYTNASTTQTMMLARLTSTGALDTTFGASLNGLVTLENVTASAEQLYAIAEDSSLGSIYVAGSAGASNGAILRKYSSTGGLSGSGVASAAVTDNNTGSYLTAKGVGVAFQYYGATSRVLLFEDGDGTHGRIVGYTPSLSALSSFGDTGTGYINTGSFGLNMGPVYGYAVGPTGDILIAYVDSTHTGRVNVAAIKKDGSGLVTQFATSGIYANVFGFSGSAVTPSNVRLTLDENHDVLVAAVDPTTGHVFVARLDGEIGILDTNFNASGVMSFAVTDSTSLSLSRITAISNNELLLTLNDDATDDTMYIARVTAAGALDTTFDSQNAIQPGVSPIQVQNKVANYTRVATGLCVQSSTGNVVLTGYETPASSSVATPMVMRLFGQSGTIEVKDYPVINEVGTLDGDFGAAGAYDLYTLLGLSTTSAATVVYSYPSGNAYEGMILVAVDNGTTTLIARIETSDMTLDSNFGASGVYTVLTSLRNATTLTIDAQNNVIVAGSIGGASWAQQLSPNATSAISFNIPTSGTPHITSINQIYQQESGRYIVVGSNTTRTASNNLIVAFQDKLVSPATELAIDTTFNPLVTGGGTTSGAGGAGYYTFVASAGIHAFALNDDDTILVAYADFANTVAADNITISKIKADGSGLVQSFNSGGTPGYLCTAIATDLPGAVVRLAVDGSGRIIVATSNSSGTQVQVARYSALGILDTGFATSGYQTITNVGSAGVTLTDMMETTTNQTILVGYNTSGADDYVNGNLFVVRLDATGALDATWNTAPQGTDTVGVLTTNIDSITQAYSAALSISGNIFIAGQTATDPLLVKVFGDNYVTEVAQQPLEVAAGVLDQTLSSGNSAWALSGLVTGTPAKIYIYQAGDSRPGAAQGSILIASTDGTNSYVTKLQADFTIDESFGTTGVVTIASPNISDLFVAKDGSIFVSGSAYISSNWTAWGNHISYDGKTYNYAIGSSILARGYAIRPTTNQRILVAGIYNGNAQIAAFNADEAGAINPGALDASFGVGGYFVTGHTGSPIYDMVVDELNRIYIAYVDMYNYTVPTVVLERILANGSAIDANFGSSTGIAITPINAVSSATQVCLAYDETNKQIVVAFTDGTSTNNIINVQRYSTAYATDGTANGSVTSGISITGYSVSLSDLLIDSDLNIYVMGSSSQSYYAFVARIKDVTGTLALDNASPTLYGTAGVANVNTSPMNGVAAGAYGPDRRIYVVGGSGYMARVFGDYYFAQDQEDITIASVATIDLTLDGDDAIPVGAIVLNTTSGYATALDGYAAQAVYAFQSGVNDGKILVAFGNSTSVRIGQFTADMNLDTANFNSSGTKPGLTEVQAMTAITSLTIDAYGKIVVSGTNSGASAAYRFTADGHTTIDTFSTSLGSTIGTTVAQQKSGRYIIGGYIGSKGVVMAYENIATAVDMTFGPAANNGYYPLGANTTPVDGLVIDNNDYIYIVYRQSVSPYHVYVAKVTANGSGLVPGFNTAGTGTGAGAPIDTGIAGAGPAFIAIDNTGTNILVAVKTSTGISTKAYACATGHTVGSTVAVIADAAVTLTDLVGSGTDFVGSAWSTASSNTMSVFRILSTGAVDTNFVASTGVASFTTASFSPLAPTAMNAATVLPDGRIVMVGGNGSNPAIARVYGYPYAGQQDAQAPDQVAAGILDLTLPYEVSGALELDTNIAGLSGLSGYTVKRVYQYGDGRMLFVADNESSTTKLFRLLKDLTLDTTGFGSGSGIVTIAQNNANGLYVDSNNNIYVVGGSSATAWAAAYDNAGNALTGWTTPTSNLVNGAYAVATQSNQRLIVAGLGSTDGYLYGYNTAGVLDTAFGLSSSGVVDMGNYGAIIDITIDSLDRIWTISNNAGSTCLQRVSADGLVVITASGTAISSVTNTSAATTRGAEVRMVQDSNHHIVVAAATGTSFTVRRYNLDGTDSAGPVTISTGSYNAHIGGLYATSDGKITLAGYDSNGNVIVARLTSAFALDTTNFAASAGFISTAIGSLNTVYDATIHADNRIMVVGTNSSSAEPYMGRVFGDNYVTEVRQAPVEGIAGFIDPTWTDGTNSGAFNYGTSILSAGYLGKAIMALADGGNYLAVDNGTISLLIRTLADGSLDTGFSTTFIDYEAGIAQAAAPSGAFSLMNDGFGRVVMVGTNGSNQGWLQRYSVGSSGYADSSFGISGLVNLSTVFSQTVSSATYAVEQTMGRIVVAGSDNAGNAVLFALTNAGAKDTTFNATGTLSHGGLVPGMFDTGMASNAIYALACDEYDRLIIAYLNGSAVDLVRLTASGEYDGTFGTNGIIAGAISAADTVSSVRLLLDHLGNIVVAATNSTNKISFHAYSNGVLTTAGANGVSLNAQVDATTLTNSPKVTHMVATVDGYTLILGNQTAGNPSWIARVKADYSGLDTAGFGTAGFFTYHNTSSSADNYVDMAVNETGRIMAVGTEIIASTNYPFVIRVYDDPFTTGVGQAPNSKVVGTNDLTFGLNSTLNGITFFAGTASASTSGQVARAIAMQDDNNIVVTVDGSTSNTAVDGTHPSQIMLNIFDNDGLPSTTFSSQILASGYAATAANYGNQYAEDMMTFTANGVNKAIVAGYVNNSVLGNSSLLMQFNLTTPGLDASFGGFDGNPAGIAAGDGQQAFVVGRQSFGRLIVGGLDQSGNGLLLGYTSTGKLDKSFATDGYLVQGTTGIYSHAIDAQNRIALAYNDGSGNVVIARVLADGTGLDTTFNNGGTIPGIINVADSISGVSSNNNIRVVVDINNHTIVAAVNTTGIVVKHYQEDGTNDKFYEDLTFGSIGVTNFVITKLLVDINGKVIVIGYDPTAGPSQIVVIRFTTDLTELDPTFNPTGTAGYIKYAVADTNTVQNSSGALIHPDGRIIIAGSKSDDLV